MKIVLVALGILTLASASCGDERRSKKKTISTTVSPPVPVLGTEQEVKVNLPPPGPVNVNCEVPAEGALVPKCWETSYGLLPKSATDHSLGVHCNLVRVGPRAFTTSRRCYEQVASGKKEDYIVVGRNSEGLYSLEGLAIAEVFLGTTKGVVPAEPGFKDETLLGLDLIVTESEPTQGREARLPTRAELAAMTIDGENKSSFAVVGFPSLRFDDGELRSGHLQLESSPNDPLFYSKAAASDAHVARKSGAAFAMPPQKSDTLVKSLLIGISFRVQPGQEFKRKGDVRYLYISVSELCGITPDILKLYVPQANALCL
jgi:hypothetical protein